MKTFKMPSVLIKNGFKDETYRSFTLRYLYTKVIGNYTIEVSPSFKTHIVCDIELDGYWVSIKRTTQVEKIVDNGWTKFLRLKVVKSIYVDSCQVVLQNFISSKHLTDCFLKSLDIMVK